MRVGLTGAVGKVASEKAIAGIGKHFSGVMSLALMGASLTPVALNAVFQADIDATNAAETGHTQWRQQVATRAGAGAGAGADQHILDGHGCRHGT
jgi:hypothetical protein